MKSGCRLRCYQVPTLQLSATATASEKNWTPKNRDASKLPLPSTLLIPHANSCAAILKITLGNENRRPWADETQSPASQGIVPLHAVSEDASLTEEEIRKDLAARYKLRRQAGWSYEMGQGLDLRIVLGRAMFYFRLIIWSHRCLFWLKRLGVITGGTSYDDDEEEGRVTASSSLAAVGLGACPCIPCIRARPLSAAARSEDARDMDRMREEMNRFASVYQKMDPAFLATLKATKEASLAFWKLVDKNDLLCVARWGNFQ
ncbi:hypothetical protein LX36DRAFT_674370 [Colletotrichum falcatum]|nr:hypothetical protein LX36DRAFT_674370 [Colletotrichum falcatum]